jgi:hypothetical protein
MPAGQLDAPATRVMKTRKGFREGVTSEIEIRISNFRRSTRRSRGRKGSTWNSGGGMFHFWGLAGRLEADLVHF